MRYKKIVSGLLACAMVVTSAFTGNVATAKAAEQPTPIATYNYNDESAGEGVSVLTTGLTEYTGDVTYGAGRNGEGDKAIVLGDYGLELPQKNLGEDYSVSMWVQPTADMENFSPILFLGYHNPELWMAIAGAWNSDEGCILWGSSAGITSADEPKFDVKRNEWTMLTLTQSGGTVSVYKNGELVKTLQNINQVLNGAEQRIYLGVNNWDAEFPGLVDDVSVYDTALDAAQVRYLYDGRSQGEILEQEGIKVSPESLSVIEGRTGTIYVEVPSAVTDCVVSYESADTSIATVDANGVVSGVKVGSTSISIKASVGEGDAKVEKTATVAVEVKKAEGKEIAVEYRMSEPVDGKLVDISGNGNDAAIHGTAGTDFDFVEENGDNVLVLKSDNAYIDLPTNIMNCLDDQEQFTIETTFVKSSACGNNAWLFCLGSKVQGTGTNYLFLSPNYNGTTLRAGIKNSGTEKLFATSIQPEVDASYTVNMVFDHGTIKLYWNGIMIQSTSGNSLQSGYSIMDDVVKPGTSDGILGYIGKSCWSADKNFQGKVSTFKVYNRAMTDAEVQSAFSERFKANFKEGVKDADLLGNNTSLSEVKYDLALPATFEELQITWKSSNENVVTSAGAVFNGTEDQKVTLTASIASGMLTAENTYEITVKALDKSGLTTVLEKARKAVNDVNATEQSRKRLQDAIAKGEAAAGKTSQTDIDQAVRALEKAISNLEYSALYKDPFTAIDESALTAARSMTPNATVRIFTVPASIKDMVTVSYKSSNTKIATVSNGVVTAKGLGNAKITTTVKAGFDGFEMEYQTIVKVDLDMKGATAKAKATKLAVGKTTQITVSASSAIKGAAYTTSYKATGAVAVNKNGKVTAKKAGTGKVYVTIKSAGKSITRTVTIKVGEITGSSSVKVKKSINLKVAGISGKVTWSLDAKGKKLATISSSGKLKAKRNAGKVTVTAKVGGVTMTKTITIKK